MNKTEKRHIILSCLSGNVLEWFDFAVYGYIATLIAPLFFPAANHFASILLSYSVFALGFFARPLGAIGFGYIGDRLGRKTALVLSSFFMAIPTCCIGLLPTYAQIGILAPILLLICRILQGLSVGGEFTGSFVYLVEIAPKGQKGFMGCWADIGCFSGMILGTFCVAFLTKILSPEQFLSFGWRIPFIAGIFLGFVGVIMRKTLREPDRIEQTPPLKHPFLTILHHQRGIFIASCFLIAINAMGFYIITVFIGNYTISLGKISPALAYTLNALTLSCMIIGTFLIAPLVDRYDNIRLYKIGCALSAILAYPLFYSVAYGSMTFQMIMMILCSLALCFVFASRPITLVHAFPITTRFTAIALCLSIANALFGGLSPLLATLLINKTQVITSPFLMIIIASGITYTALHYLKKQRQLVRISQDEITETVAITYSGQ